MASSTSLSVSCARKNGVGRNEVTRTKTKATNLEFITNKLATRVPRRNLPTHRGASSCEAGLALWPGPTRQTRKKCRWSELVISRQLKRRIKVVRCDNHARVKERARHWVRPYEPHRRQRSRSFRCAGILRFSESICDSDLSGADQQVTGNRGNRP